MILIYIILTDIIKTLILKINNDILDKKAT